MDQTFKEAAAKARARILLLDGPGLVVPDLEEWIGINLLERDDQLPRVNHDNKNKKETDRSGEP